MVFFESALKRTQNMDTKNVTPAKPATINQPEFGLTFRGKVVSMEDRKPWNDFKTKEVLGVSQTIGLTDNRRIYTMTLKSKMGDAHPEVKCGDIISLSNAGCNSDMGQHRLSGDLKSAA